MKISISHPKSGQQLYICPVEGGLSPAYEDNIHYLVMLRFTGRGGGLGDENKNL